MFMRPDVVSRLKRATNGLVGNDMTKLGSGLRRDVYRINTNRFGSMYKGKVVKYANDSKNIKDNEREFQTWMAVKGTSLEENFCPVRDRSKNYEFIIMDYARPIESFVRSDYSDFKDKITSEMAMETIFDFHGGNVGYHKEFGLVMVDYPFGGKFEKLK